MAAQTGSAGGCDNKDLRSVIQSKVAEGMMGVFELVISDRKAHFATHPESVPERASVPYLVTSYSTTNAAISGGASLVPGPWGMLAVVPEITAVMRNQLAMIYDVGMAYGKKEVLTKELLAGVLVTAMGAGAGSLLVMRGEQVLVRRVALRGFQRIIELLAGRATQQVLKSMVSKWLPVVGAAAIAAWSNYSTRQVGKRAVEVFEKDVVLLDELVDDTRAQTEGSVADVIEPARPNGHSPDMPRVQALMNLMHVDGSAAAEEVEYTQALITNACLTQAERDELTQALQTGSKFSIDYSAFASSPDDAIGLLVDMVALAQRDGRFHVTEMMFVKQVGKLLGFPESDVEAVMAAAG